MEPGLFVCQATQEVPECKKVAKKPTILVRLSFSWVDAEDRNYALSSELHQEGYGC